MQFVRKTKHPSLKTPFDAHNLPKLPFDSEFVMRRVSATAVDPKQLSPTERRSGHHPVPDLPENYSRE